MKKMIKNGLILPEYLQILSRLLSNPSKKLSFEDQKLLERSKELKNIHHGKRCFILGAGSSIKKQNLLNLVGENVISVSNTFVHPDYEKIKPKYHVLPPLITSHSQINKESDWTAWLKEMDKKTLDADMFLHLGDRQLISKNCLFRNKKIFWVEYEKWDEGSIINIDLMKIPSIWSVSEAAITIALYLGYEKIYLLGFDHDWFNGPLVYFYDEKKDHAMKPTAEKLTFADAEFQMRRHAYIFRKYKNLYALKENIFNANADPKHYLDVFPKVDFDSLFLT